MDQLKSNWVPIGNSNGVPVHFHPDGETRPSTIEEIVSHQNYMANFILDVMEGEDADKLDFPHFKNLVLYHLSKAEDKYYEKFPTSPWNPEVGSQELRSLIDTTIKRLGEVLLTHSYRSNKA